jgi:hypothetical protein
MKRGKKQIIKMVVSMMLVALLMIQPFASFRSHAEDKTVDLTKITKTGSRHFKDSNSMDSFRTYKGEKITNNFLYFDAAWKSDEDYAYVTYNLNGKYKKFTCTVLTGEETGKGVFNVYFYGDGKRLDDYVGDLNKEDHHEYIEISVKGVKKFEIRAIRKEGSSSDSYVYVKEPKMVVDSSSSTTTDDDDDNNNSGPTYNTDDISGDAAKNLTSLKKKASSHAMVISRVTTPGNKTYTNNVIHMDASCDPCYISYNLNKKYEKITGKIVSSKDTGDARFVVKFYGDGKLLKTYKNITREKTVSYSVNLKKCKVLKVTAVNYGDYDNGYVHLVNSKLSGGDLKLNAKSIILGVDGTKNMTVKYKNKKIAANKCSWSSSNSKVADVNSKGKIVAFGSGACTITCTYGKVKTSVVVFVKPKKIDDLRITNLGTTEVTMTFSPQATATGYELLEYNDKLEEYRVIQKISKTTIKITNLKSNTAYNYAVRGYSTIDGKNYAGDLSDPLKFTTLKP